FAVVVTVRATGTVPSAAVALSAQAPSAQAPAPMTPGAQAPATPAQPAGYAGSDTCVVCHEHEDESLKGTPHSTAKDPRSPAAAHGCESCHGPSQAPADDNTKRHIQKKQRST